MNYLQVVRNPRFPNCNIYHDYTFTVAGISIHLTGDQGYVVDLAGINFESPEQLATLNAVQKARYYLDAHFNLMTLWDCCRDYLNSDREFLSHIPLYMELLAGFAAPAGADVLRLWTHLEKQQSFLAPTLDAETLHHYVSRLTQEIAHYARWRGMLLDTWRYPCARHGFVYLFRLSTGHYKIGLSVNPGRRSKQLISGFPFTIEVIHTIPSNHIGLLEQELHRRYQGKRHGHTEWFNLDETDVAEVVAIKEVNYDWIENPEFTAWDKAYREIHYPTLNRVPEFAAL